MFATCPQIIRPSLNGLEYREPIVYRVAEIKTFWSSLASTVFQQFIAADNSSETFAGLKRIHGLMPYFMMKTALKISNPIGMIRSKPA